MKKYTAPNMEMKNFNSENVITTSGEAPVKENAVTAATAYLNNEQVADVLTITL